MDLASAKMIGAGLAGIGVGAAAIGVGIVFGQFLNSAIRNPPDPRRRLTGSTRSNGKSLQATGRTGMPPYFRAGPGLVRTLRQ